ncbi:MAG TPA: prepilin-type N-terminal cleavage/methylation domain-containing protein [Stenomitos sp.]
MKENHSFPAYLSLAFLKNRNTKGYSQSHGFTLIEALISVTTIGILAAIAAPGFIAWTRNQQINVALAQIEGTLKEAQSVAIRKNRSCIITIEDTKIRVQSTAYNFCLPSGSTPVAGQPTERAIGDNDTVLSKKANSSIKIAGTVNTDIEFASKGNAVITPDTSAIVLYRADEASGGTMKCLVVANGIGIIRTGKYVASAPPVVSNPPTGTEIQAIANNCISSS